MTANKRLKAAEYDSLAENALAMAEACTLEHVRTKHRRAAAAWAELAVIQRLSGAPTAG